MGLASFLDRFPFLCFFIGLLRVKVLVFNPKLQNAYLSKFFIKQNLPFVFIEKTIWKNSLVKKSYTQNEVTQFYSKESVLTSNAFWFSANSIASTMSLAAPLTILAYTIKRSSRQRSHVASSQCLWPVQVRRETFHTGKSCSSTLDSIDIPRLAESIRSVLFVERQVLVAIRTVLIDE